MKFTRQFTNPITIMKFICQFTNPPNIMKLTYYDILYISLSTHPPFWNFQLSVHQPTQEHEIHNCQFTFPSTIMNLHVSLPTAQHYEIHNCQFTNPTTILKFTTVSLQTHPPFLNSQLSVYKPIQQYEIHNCLPPHQPLWICNYQFTSPPIIMNSHVSLPTRPPLWNSQLSVYKPSRHSEITTVSLPTHPTK